MFTNLKLKKHGKTFALLLVFTSLIILGFFTYYNHRTFSFYQKGMQIRNTYSEFRIEKIDNGSSYSRFPHRLFEIKADENTLYSYRDDFYKPYGESDRNKIVIFLTQRQVFDNPVALGKQPECEAMAKIESEKRQPEYYENGPNEFDLKWQDENRAPFQKVYIYTPKNGHCKNVFSDSQKLKVQGNANSIRLSF